MSDPQVKINQGTLRGSVATNIKGGTFYSFQGIPYAKPPVGNLRFKAPVPPEKWAGIFDATREGDPSYHFDFYTQTIVGSENCLVLNVYTKKISKKGDTLNPVLFWIHGGGFVVGSSTSEIYSPEFLLSEDVVLVTINYRLGLLGFLSLEDPSLGVPGNAGLKDMVMALKWVQKNVDRFGGDPDNVTVFGESAGGSSVHLLTLSPLSQGLFHKGIAQSGCALNPWLPGERGVDHIAEVEGLEADEKAVYDYFRGKSVEQIYEIQQKLSDDFNPSHRRKIGLVVEKNSAEPAFLAADAIEIMLSGNFSQVPLIFGYTTAEGMCFDMFKPPNYPLEPVFEDEVSWLLGYQCGTDEAKSVADKLRKFYYGAEEPNNDNIRKKYDLVSDVAFIYGIYAAVLIHRRVSQTPLYVYRFSVESDLNFFKNKYLGAAVPGVSHQDDIGYLFKTFATPEIKAGSREKLYLDRVTKLWTNFAKFGNPTPETNDQLLNVAWKPLEEDKELQILDIGANLVVTSNPEQERINFWEQLFVNSPAGKHGKSI